MFGCISELSDEERNEKEKIIKNEIMEWIRLLVTNVGMHSENVVEYFEKLLLKQAAVGFRKKYTAVVTKLVSDKIIGLNYVCIKYRYTYTYILIHLYVYPPQIHDRGRESAKALKVQQFYTLFSEMKIWKFEVCMSLFG